LEKEDTLKKNDNYNFSSARNLPSKKIKVDKKIFRLYSMASRFNGISVQWHLKIHPFAENHKTNSLSNYPDFDRMHSSAANRDKSG